MTYKAEDGALRHDLYTEVTGDGNLDITVNIVPPENVRHIHFPHPRDSIALARVIGGEFVTMDSGRLPQWLIRASGDTTDFEHDTSSFIRLEIMNPVVISAYEETTYIGMLADAQLWPLGVDPMTQGDSDTQPGMCDGDPGQPGEHAPHPFAAYRPPDRDEVQAILPSFVIITTVPIRLPTRD